MTKAFKLYSTATVGLALVGLWLAGWSVGAVDRAAHWNALVAFLVLGFLTEASYLSLKVGPSQTSSSVSFIPYVATVLLFDTGWAAGIAGLSTLAVDVVVRRKPAFRATFNVAQIVVSVLAASWVYQSLGGSFSLAAFHLVPWAGAAAIATYFFVNITAVSFAVALFYGVRLDEAWVRIAGASFVYDLFTSLFGPLLAFLYVQIQLVGIVALILPLYFIRHIYQVNLQLEQVNRDLLELMVKAIEARDPYTSGHSLRVSQIAEILAREFGLGHKLVEQIRTAALLHDVGKIHEEYAPLLRKEGKLDATEKALMQTHSARSADLVSTISAFKGVITEAVRHHHENVDGTGYPGGIAGSAIPVGSRIIMIADTIDAMTTDRPYRRALSFETVRAELSKYAGRQFDPGLVEVCLRSNAVKDLVSRRIDSQHEVATIQTAGDRAPSYQPRMAVEPLRRTPATR